MSYKVKMVLQITVEQIPLILSHHLKSLPCKNHHKIVSPFSQECFIFNKPFTFKVKIVLVLANDYQYKLDMIISFIN